MLNSVLVRIQNVIHLTNRRVATLSDEDYMNVTNVLQVNLPEDFRYLNGYLRYDFLETGFVFYNWRIGQNYSIFVETQALRDTWNLPHEYIVLAEDDTYMLLMKTISRESCEVIWCDHEDFDNLCKRKPFQYNPTIFPSFTAFYEYLIDEEERLLAEEEDES